MPAEDSLEPTPIACSGDSADCLPGGALDDNFWPSLWLRVGIVLVLAGQGMVFGLGLNTAEPPLTVVSPVYWLLHGGLLLSAVVALVLLGGPLLRETWYNLRLARITVESLFTISMLGALVGSLVSSLRGQGSVYYEVVAVVLAIYTVGKALGVRGKSRALAEANKLEAALDYAMVESLSSENSMRRVPVGELTRECVVVVAPGDMIPVDGQVLRGKAYVQEQPLTGEPAPVVRGAGDSVLAGTHPVDGTLYITPEKLKGARRFDELLESVREAREKTSRLQNDADQMTRFFVPVVCVVSLVTFLGWLPFVGWGEALFNAMAVLIVACPCALGLATPAAVWVGLATLARIGVVARQGDILEDLARARTYVFDKTGTLSLERLSVADVQIQKAWVQRKEELVAGILAIETPLRHPVAEALTLWARGESASLKAKASEVRLVPAKGLTAEVETPGGVQQWRIGSKPFALEEGASKDENGILWLSIDAEPAASFRLAESLRPSAETALRSLRDAGCRVSILSGDPAPAWSTIGGVGIEYGLTPTEKAVRVKKLRVEGGPVLFVGDGVNDAPAMAEADAAIALESGAGLSQETAGAVLIGGDIAGLPAARDFAQKLIRAVRGNLRFALVYNLFGMSLAAAGILHPVVAALLMLGSSAFVSGRIMRVAGRKPASIIVKPLG